MGAPFGIVVVNLARISSRPRGFARNPSMVGRRRAKPRGREGGSRGGSGVMWPNVECRRLNPLPCLCHGPS